MNETRFVKDELVTKLGIVDGAQLEARLPTDGNHGAGVNRPLGCERVLLGRAAGFDAVDHSLEPIDFSDISDDRWETELELARQEAELVRARDETKKQAFLMGAECWEKNSMPVILETSDFGNDAPPPLVSDSESGSEHEGDGNYICGGGEVQGHGEKVNGCLKKSGKITKKVKGTKHVTFSRTADSAANSSASASAAPDGANGLAEQNRADDNAAAFASGAVAPASVSVAPGGAARATGGGHAGVKKAGNNLNQRRRSGSEVETGVNMEEYTAIERWVKDVASGRVTARAVQLQRFFRGRLDERGSGLVLYRILVALLPS